MYKLIKVKPSSTGFDIRVNFWQDNYQLRYIEPFKQLYDRDTSENKVVSSSEMWAVWLLQDPSYDNKIFRLSEQDKRSAVKSYCPNFDFEDEVINKCLISYSELCLSNAAKAFLQEEKSLQERSELIDKIQREQGYTLDEFVSLGNNRWGNKKGTASQLEAIRKNTAGIYKQYIQIRAAFEEEQNNVRLYGGGKETLMEKGGLVLVEDEDE